MLKTCKECGRLFSGEGTLCSNCKSKATHTKQEIGNCKSCQILTARLVEGYCYTCGITHIEPFKIVKHYLYINPHKTIKEVSENTGVSTTKIEEYVREGKLEIKDSPNLLKKEKNECKSCGKTISHGNLCSFCKKNKEAITEARGDLLRAKNNKKKSKSSTKFHLNKNK